MSKSTDLKLNLELSFLAEYHYTAILRLIRILRLVRLSSAKKTRFRRLSCKTKTAVYYTAA